MSEPAKNIEAVDPATQEFISAEQAAKLLGIATRTLYEEIKNSQPPWAKKFGRIIRIHRTKLIESFGQPANSNRKR